LTNRQPAFFIGHGSPMNAIEQNRFSQKWREVGESLAPPRAVVCISAHWLTRGTQITASAKPKTIHDFGGFPKQLFQVQYPAPGSPEIAKELQNALKGTVDATLTEDWGLDHGTWSILVHMHAKADVPVLQLSIDASVSPEKYVEIGRKLRPLRDQGILFIGSGNIVHHLGLVDWSKLDQIGFAHDWAREADTLIRRLVHEKDHKALAKWHELGKSVQTAVNSAEHFLPLLYILGLAHDSETESTFNAEAVGGAITMTSFRFG